MSCISVVIPALNEEQWIERTLESIAVQPGTKEIIVADGHSTDRTRQAAGPYACVIEAPRGRAVQMNAGAKRATGGILLFLHADTVLPEDAFPFIRQQLLRGATEAGTFRLSFDRSSPLLQFYSICTRMPTSLLCFGDRGLFVRRDVFEAVGGYPEIPIFEDLELARTLHDRGRFVFSDLAVTTAARRFERNGPLRQQLRNTYLWLFYMLGGDLQTLADDYNYSV